LFEGKGMAIESDDPGIFVAPRKLLKQVSSRPELNRCGMTDSQRLLST
jgi:hypothetical protein